MDYKPLPVGIDNFEMLVTRGYYFLDKTMLIKELLDKKGSVNLFTRPRRFGKSITANMLTAYYSKGCDSEEMFSGLEISKSPDFKMHLNQYDVIHLDIQWFLSNAKDADHVVAYVTNSVLAELREVYPEQLPAF